MTESLEGGGAVGSLEDGEDDLDDTEVILSLEEEENEKEDDAESDSESESKSTGESMQDNEGILIDLTAEMMRGACTCEAVLFDFEMKGTYELSSTLCAQRTKNGSWPMDSLTHCSVSEKWSGWSPKMVAHCVHGMPVSAKGCGADNSADRVNVNGRVTRDKLASSTSWALSTAVKG